MGLGWRADIHGTREEGRRTWDYRGRQTHMGLMEGGGGRTYGLGRRIRTCGAREEGNDTWG